MGRLKGIMEVSDGQIASGASRESRQEMRTGDRPNKSEACFESLDKTVEGGHRKHVLYLP